MPLPKAPSKPATFLQPDDAVLAKTTQKRPTKKNSGTNVSSQAA